LTTLIIRPFPPARCNECISSVPQNRKILQVPSRWDASSRAVSLALVAKAPEASDFGCNRLGRRRRLQMIDEPIRYRRAQDIYTPMPERILAKFGGPQARPRLVQAYDARHGWNTDRRHQVVTVELLVELQNVGVTLIEARWRSHTARLSVASVLAATA
jgi:hypothetical protein